MKEEYASPAERKSLLLRQLKKVYEHPDKKVLRQTKCLLNLCKEINRLDILINFDRVTGKDHKLDDVEVKGK